MIRINRTDRFPNIQNICIRVIANQKWYGGGYSVSRLMCATIIGWWQLL